MQEIPDFFLEQLMLDELSQEKKAELLKDPRTAHRLQELEESNRQIRERYDFGAFAQKLAEMPGEPEKIPTEPRVLPFVGSEVSSGKSRRIRFLSITAPVLAAAAALLIVVLPLVNNPAAPGSEIPDGSVRLKGLEPQLNIYRKKGSAVELLKPNQKVASRDLLQISYQGAGKRYGTIFSIDGNGFVTLHYPESPSQSPELTQGGEVPLDFSYQLDDAPGFERFFFVVSDSYFSVTQVLNSAALLAGSFYDARDGELTLPEVCESESILLIKEGIHD